MAWWIRYCTLCSQLWTVGNIGKEHCDELSQVVHHFTCVCHWRGNCSKTIVLHASMMLCIPLQIVYQQCTWIF